VLKRLHWFDINQSQSQNLLNLLPWLAFATTSAACYMTGLWRVQKLCRFVRITLVLWH